MSLDGTGGFEILDFFGTDTEFRQDFVRMFAEHRRVQADRSRRGVELDSHALNAQIGDFRVRQIDNQFLVQGLFQRDDLID